MKMLLNGNRVIGFAPQIEFGKFEKPFKEWKLSDEMGNLICYWIDSDFTLVENVEVPSDYADGKYFFENGEFVLNAEWKPYVSPEERIAQLEAQNEMLMSCVLEMSEIVYA